MSSTIDTEGSPDRSKVKKKKKHKHKSAKRGGSGDVQDGPDDNGVRSKRTDNAIDHELKKKKKDKKRKRDGESAARDNSDSSKKKKKKHKADSGTNKKYFSFEYEHILAPMVGASELAFRLLCRKYGATLAYTPMMSASQFIEEASVITFTSDLTVANSNICEFQTIPEDRPLVCHFSANNPQHFAKAAKLVEPYCDAIDLNLGCPQRTAFVGHFGSYLLGDEDRYVA
jgi:hypothetical protein